MIAFVCPRIRSGLCLLLLILPAEFFAQGGWMEVGLASADITPTMPIRLAGYGAREPVETTKVMHRLKAKAIAFGSDAQRPSVLITVDLLGIPGRITEFVRRQLAQRAGIEAACLAICASHTHGGPEPGNTINILAYRHQAAFGDSAIALHELVHIAQYTDWLQTRLTELAMEALRNRAPSKLGWGQGQVLFAANRRTRGGPVDVAFPMIAVHGQDGKLRGVLVNYACHGTTLEGINEINGDWIAEAQLQIEKRHPGALALVALGCGGDANPRPRGEVGHMKAHGKEVADQVDKLLATVLMPLTEPPMGKMAWIDLPFAHVPTVPELIEGTGNKDGLRGYYARLALERVVRGETVPAAVRYPVQVWSFGDKLAMVNLAGEVVVDYALRLKNELGAEHLWVNGYTNDVPCYIASRRVIREGGYEADYSMVCYDKPGPFAEEVEDLIVETVHKLMPASFRAPRPETNKPEIVRADADGNYVLEAYMAEAVGSDIKYMPEWKAFGWFNTGDYAAWDIDLKESGLYALYLNWSVSDDAAGKTFAFSVGGKKLRGKIGKTGSWFTYAEKKLGEIRLTAGKHRAQFGSGNLAEKGPMLDLARIKLVKLR